MVIRRSIRGALSTLVALTVVLFASAAAACPVCASREEPTSLRWVALGAFIISPWIVAGVIAFYIKKGAAEERQQLPTENIE